MNIHKLKHVFVCSSCVLHCLQRLYTNFGGNNFFLEVSEPVQSVSDTNNPNQFHEYSDYELDASYDENNCAVITLSGSGASSNGTGVSVSGSVVTITKKGAI